MTRRRRALEELDQQIRDHIEHEIQDNMTRGMTPEEARSAALRAFGNITRVKEDARAVWIPVWLDRIVQDARCGLRVLRKNPGFTAVAVITLALSIGINAAVFTVTNAVLFKGFPFVDRNDRILYISSRGYGCCVSISTGIFRLLGQRPVLGRDFVPSDEAPAPVAILTYSLWEDRYGKDPAIVGRTVRIDNIPTTVIGVIPRGIAVFGRS